MSMHPRQERYSVGLTGKELMRTGDSTRTRTALGPGMRALLIACGPLNLVGAVGFAPPVLLFRTALGLPEPHPFYLWVLSSWVLAFGLAYVHQGISGRANRGVLALGIVGKASFGGLLMQLALSGQLPVFARVAAVLISSWPWCFRGGCGRRGRRPDGSRAVASGTLY
jgi:hypothetical protein